METITVQDTSDWMARCRASNETLSLDRFAKYWCKEEGKAAFEKYLKEVSSSEKPMMCLRNRFFLESMERFFQKFPDGVFINIGAGLTNYPYLFSEVHPSIEVDCAKVIDAKRAKIKELEASGALPPRPVSFIACNLNVEGAVGSLFSTLYRHIAGKPSFILIEGVLYYLNKMAIEDFFLDCRGIQKVGSQLGVVSWQPSFLRGEFFRRFSKFLLKELKTPLGTYTCLENAVFEGLPGYSVVEHVDNPRLMARYLPEVELSSVGPFADEQMFVLERR